jgi:hypothetical protein
MAEDLSRLADRALAREALEDRWQSRVIILVDLNAFYAQVRGLAGAQVPPCPPAALAQVAEIMDPSLRDRPLAVVQKSIIGVPPSRSRYISLQRREADAARAAGK